MIRLLRRWTHSVIASQILVILSEAKDLVMKRRDPSPYGLRMTRGWAGSVSSGVITHLLCLLALVVVWSSPSHAQSLDISFVEDNIFEISSVESDLAVEVGYSKFSCEVEILEKPRFEYLDYAKRKRYIHEFPLIIERKTSQDTECLWWVRLCTRESCYFPQHYVLSFDDPGLRRVSKEEGDAWLASQSKASGQSAPTLSEVMQQQSRFDVFIQRLVGAVAGWTFLLGLLLGILAGVNPCNLPLIPLILHYSHARRGVWWVTGGAFVTIWILMMALVGGGKFFGQSGIIQWLGNWVHLIFAIVLVTFGVWALKGSFDRLQQWMTQQTETLPRRHVGGFVWGVVFAFLSIPCVGPILAIYGVLLFNAQRNMWLSGFSFSLGFVSWFFLWSFLGSRIRTISREVFKAFEIALGIAFIVLGLWRGYVFAQGLAIEVTPYVQMTFELDQHIAQWRTFQKLQAPPATPQRLYFLSAPWCVECQPYVAELKAASERYPIEFINIDSLSEETISALRDSGIIGVPAFVWIQDDTLFYRGTLDLKTLDHLFR